ncbi:hypothetical protein [Staphylococcus haemolyticus]
MDNIFNMDGSKKEDVNIKNQIYELKSMLPYERLTNLRQQGFTEEEAIEIIKAEHTPFDQQ